MQLTLDPRYYQLIIQALLLFWGIIMLDFLVTPNMIIGVIISALGVQWLFCIYYTLPLYTLSTLNTSLSILLLLHSTNIIVLCFAVIIATASKFLFRWKQRHIFNPSNIGIVITLLLFDQAWAAPGQWGHNIWILLLIAGFGLIPITNIRVMATSISFLGFYTLIILIRSYWLEDPLTIPLHQLQNGALLLFSFFMLADPMTTPNHYLGKIIYGAWVAILSAVLLFHYYIPNAFLYALALSAPVVILINEHLKESNFRWKKSYH